MVLTSGDQDLAGFFLQRPTLEGYRWGTLTPRIYSTELSRFWTGPVQCKIMILFQLRWELMQNYFTEKPTPVWVTGSLGRGPSWLRLLQVGSTIHSASLSDAENMWNFHRNCTWIFCGVCRGISPTVMTQPSELESTIVMKRLECVNMLMPTAWSDNQPTSLVKICWISNEQQSPLSDKQSHESYKVKGNEIQSLFYFILEKIKTFVCVCIYSLHLFVT